MHLSSDIDQEHSYLSEMTRDMRKTRKARFYTFGLLFRRIVYVFSLIILQKYSKYYLVSILTIFQLLYFVRLVVMTPYVNMTENLIEVTNEVFFIILSGSLFYLNNDTIWDGLYTEVYIYVLISNNVVVLAIIIGSLTKDLVIKCKNKCTREVKTMPKKLQNSNLFPFRPSVSVSQPRTATDCNLKN